MKSNMHITAVAMIKTFERPLISFLSGMSVSRVATSLAILPMKVSAPVAITMASPLPATIAVPLKTILRRSKIGRRGFVRSLGCLFTATDSPVSAASSTLRLRAVMRRASAGIFSPSWRIIMSPGTTFSSAIICSSPSRITTALVSTNFLRASMVLRALPSCMAPIIALKTSTAVMTMLSTISPMKSTTMPAMSRI